MSSSVKGMAEQAVPWRRNIAWWIVLVEGGLAAALGIFIFMQPGQSGAWLVQLIGAILLINSGLRIFSALSGRVPLEHQPLQLLHGGIGFVVGLLVVLQPWFTYLDQAAAVVILATGLILVALIGFYISFRQREGGFRWGTVLVNVIYLVFAALLIYALRNQAGSAVMQIFGGIFTLAGILLMFYAIILHRSQRSASPAAVTTPALATASDAASGASPTPSAEAAAPRDAD